MGSSCSCALSWPPPELSIRGAGQKDRSSGDENAALPDQWERLRVVFRFSNQLQDLGNQKSMVKSGLHLRTYAAATLKARGKALFTTNSQTDAT